MFKELNILKPFLEEPSREFNVREIARILKIAPATASSQLKKMFQSKILKERLQKLFKMYSANLESDLYRDIKVFYNIRKLKESNFIKELDKFYLKPTIILFGSASKGLDTKESDFDLAIISEKISKMETERYEKELDRRIQIFPVKNIANLKNIELIKNVSHGIVIQGEIK